MQFFFWVEKHTVRAKSLAQEPLDGLLLDPWSQQTNRYYYTLGTDHITFKFKFVAKLPCYKTPCGSYHSRSQRSQSFWARGGSRTLGTSLWEYCVTGCSLASVLTDLDQQNWNTTRIVWYLFLAWHGEDDHNFITCDGISLARRSILALFFFLDSLIRLL